MRELLPGVQLEGLPEGVELPPEDAEGFAEIALEKARAAFAATGEPTIADDSGIGAVGLGGRPGIHSARYGGEGASDEENLAKLLLEVAAAGAERGAYYTCALALIEADGAEHVVRSAQPRPPDRAAARRGRLRLRPRLRPRRDRPRGPAHLLGDRPGGEE